MTTQKDYIFTPTHNEPRALLVGARVISTMLSPLLVPTYGVILALWLTILAFIPLGARCIVTGSVWLMTCLLPMLAILVLWKLNVVSNPRLNNRRERHVPYFVTSVCYLGCAYYLWRLNAPTWLWTFMAGGAIAVAVCLMVNCWWKISAHMTAMAGLVAVMFRIASDGVNIHFMPVWITGGVLLLGMLGTSRVLLRRHTVMQTLAGTVVGFLSVYLLSMI